MNILFITRPLGSPWNEGGKNLAYGIAKNIKNHKIHILVRKDFNEKIGSNVILHRIYPARIKRKVSFFERLKLFLFLLKVKNIDIYHFIYTPELYSSFINKLFLKLKRRKSIQTIPTTLKRISNKLFFSEKIVTISAFTKNLLLRNGIKDVVRINTGIDTNHFKPLKKNINLLNNFNLNKKFVIFIPIDLEKEKGSRLILKLIGDTRDLDGLIFLFSYRSTKKSILEENYLRSNLIKLGLSSRVLFIKDPQDIRNLINISNIVIYSKVNTYEKHEIPMILMECMAMEKPIIIFNIPPLNEIIKNDEGIMVRGYFEMKDSVINLVYNRHLIEKMGKLARERILNDFNITKIAKEYDKLYTNLS